MAASPPSASAFRVSDLPQKAQTPFTLTPDAPTLRQIAAALGLDGLRKLRLEGHIAPQGKTDWRLDATLGATVTQPCCVTLAPVTTRIDASVTRIYMRDYVEPDTAETEMPEDDTVEPLTSWIDPEAVMIEALSLALPEYPRADDAALGEVVVTEKGKVPLRDADMNPFAALSALKSKLDGDPDD